MAKRWEYAVLTFGEGVSFSNPNRRPRPSPLHPTPDNVLFERVAYNQWVNPYQDMHELGEEGFELVSVSVLPDVSSTIPMVGTPSIVQMGVRLGYGPRPRDPLLQPIGNVVMYFKRELQEGE